MIDNERKQCKCTGECEHIYLCKHCLNGDKSIKDTLSCRFKKSCCCFSFYSIGVVIIAVLLSYTVLCLFNKLEHQDKTLGEIHNVDNQVDCCEKSSSNSYSKEFLKNSEKHCRKGIQNTQNPNTKNRFTFYKPCINNYGSNNNSNISLEKSHSTLNNGIIWLIGFLIFTILALILSIPICFASRTKRYMQFYLDDKELDQKYHISLEKEKIENKKLETELEKEKTKLQTELEKEKIRLQTKGSEQNNG